MTFSSLWCQPARLSSFSSFFFLRIVCEVSVCGTRAIWNRTGLCGQKNAPVATAGNMLRTSGLQPWKKERKKEKDFCFITFWTMRCIILYKWDYNTWTFGPTELKNCFHEIEWLSVLEHCICLHLSTVGQHILLLLVVSCLHFPQFHDANSVCASKTSSSRHTNNRLWFSGDGGRILCLVRLSPFF